MTAGLSAARVVVVQGVCLVCAAELKFKPQRYSIRRSPFRFSPFITMVQWEENLREARLNETLRIAVQGTCCNGWEDWKVATG